MGRYLPTLPRVGSTPMYCTSTVPPRAPDSQTSIQRPPEMDMPVLTPNHSAATTAPFTSAFFPPPRHSLRDPTALTESPAVPHGLQFTTVDGRAIKLDTSAHQSSFPLAPPLSTIPHHESTQTSIPEESRSAKPHRHCLTRDQRRDILLMRSLGHTYHQICKHLNVPFGAVQYTCQKRSASPKRRPGRARRLTDEKLEEIETFITSSIENRQMTYQEVVTVLGLEVKEDTLTQALRRRGLVRQMAFLKSPLAVGNITAKPVRTYLTCRKDEEIDSPLVVEVIKRRSG